jgi:hypothetical protein
MKQSFPRSAGNLGAFGALVVFLSACSSVGPDPYLTTQAVTATAKPTVTDVAPEFAAASLPSLAGGVHTVRQDLSGHALHQDIVYANQTTLSGENILTVDIGAPEGASMLRPPNAAEVRREIRAMLPSGVNPVISAVIGRNINGGYGYATASLSSGGSCIYAWQRLKSEDLQDATALQQLTQSHLMAQIRLRYCHPAIRADQIHVLMDGMQVTTVNSRTIDMLRYAAHSAQPLQAQPALALAPAPAVTDEAPRPVRKRITQRQAPAAPAEADDWRAEAKAATARPAVTEAAVTVPLPDTSSMPAKVAEAAKTPSLNQPAVTVPLPE